MYFKNFNIKVSDSFFLFLTFIFADRILLTITKSFHYFSMSINFPNSVKTIYFDVIKNR